MGDKSDKSDEPRRPGRVWLISILAIAPLLYVLGWGPACWLSGRGYLCEQIPIFYTPLLWLAEKSSLFNSFINWYEEFW